MTEANEEIIPATEPAEPAEVQSEEPAVERRWSKKSSGKSPIPEVKPVGAEEVEKERKRADDLLDRLQRSMADLSNYRKRVEAEREEMAKLASMLLVADLLPVLDNFERALDAIPPELEHFSWLQGIALIERHLSAILDRQGVEPIEAVGKDFNPNLHEAIVEEESAESKPGTVIGELQKGYTMHGHVLRPTLAKIAKAPQPQAPETNQATADTSTEEPSDSESEPTSTDTLPAGSDTPTSDS